MGLYYLDKDLSIHVGHHLPATDKLQQALQITQFS